MGVIDRLDYLIGVSGYASVRIPGGNVPGEIRVVSGGATHKFVAYAEHEVAEGAECWISGIRGGHAVDVRSA